MSSVTGRITERRKAERDYQRGLIHAYGQARIEISAKLARIRRQIAMLTEDDRPLMEAPNPHTG